MKTDLTILFDLDGTLINSTSAILESFYHALKAHGYARPLEREITSRIGHPLQTMFGALGVEAGKIDSVVATYKAHYRTVATQKTSLLPRADEAVIFASKFGALGVVTTKTSRYSREILEHLGIAKYFKTIVGFEDTKEHKPHPEPVLKALQDLGAADLSAAWLIGDTQLDVLAAGAAKINAYAVTSGYESRASLEAFTQNIKPSALDAVIDICTNRAQF